ncbi:MAG: endolytic transglycosylase MltG [Patescibacteria group bacterium]
MKRPLKRRTKRRLIIGGVLAAGLWLILFGPNNSFPAPRVVKIDKGLGVTEIATVLKEEKLIKWPIIFRLALAFGHGPALVVAGDYYFDHDPNVWQVAARLRLGDYGRTPTKVTFPEGAHGREMATILAKALPNFDTDQFLTLATPLEGYLFPDTYYFQASVSPEMVIDSLQKNFARQTAELMPLAAASGRTWEQVVIMASLLEEEARDFADRQMIAGLLWKRLDQGMPLQVDAVFPYISDKNTFELNRTDLATSSPYNTYRFRGLPIGPITNPGLESIRAALTPTESKYFFYLSDLKGQMHYAVDFDEHRANKAKYLP